MNDTLRIASLKIALQRAFLGRAILIFTIRIFCWKIINMKHVVLYVGHLYKLFLTKKN